MAIALGVATFVAALLAVVMYARQARIARTAAMDAAYVPVSQAFLTHPELRPIFYEDDEGDSRLPDLGDPATRLRASVVAEQMCDALEQSLGRDRAGRLVRAFIGDAFDNSAYLTTWLLRHEKWYDKRLVAHAKTAHDRRRSAP